MKFKNFSLKSENKFSETEITENFYEIGKWFGDRIGFPRVGVVSKTIEMIKDTYEFLKTIVEENRITVEIQVKNPETDLEDVLKELSIELGIAKQQIKISPNPKMYGNYVIRVFTQSRVLFRKLEEKSKTIYNMKPEIMAKFLAGFADAEMTVEKRTSVLAFSMTSKTPENANKIKSMLESVLSGKISIRSAGTDELKIQVPNILIRQFNEKIGKYMRNKNKSKRIIELLNNDYFLPKDIEILELVKNNPMCTSSDLSKKLNIHIDSTRRILRLLSKQGIIKRFGRGIYGTPYRFFCDSSCDNNLRRRLGSS